MTMLTRQDKVNVYHTLVASLRALIGTDKPDTPCAHGSTCGIITIDGHISILLHCLIVGHIRQCRHGSIFNFIITSPDQGYTPCKCDKILK
jgi:hypothetical protein